MIALCWTNFYDKRMAKEWPDSKIWMRNIRLNVKKFEYSNNSLEALAMAKGKKPCMQARWRVRRGREGRQDRGGWARVLHLEFGEAEVRGEREGALQDEDSLRQEEEASERPNGDLGLS